MRKGITTKILFNIIKDLKEIDEYGKHKYTYQEIADRYNTHISNIFKISKKEKLLRYKKINSKTINNIIKDLQELDDKGNYKYTQQEIADKYNFSLSTISRISKNESLLRYKK